MKSLNTLLLLTAMLAVSVQAQATTGPGGTTPSMGDAKAEASTPVAEIIDGEIRKVDKDAKKITIKHGAIKSLDMPGMTMVFLVKDPAMLDRVKTGDKVRFKAEKVNGAFVVTDIQLTK